MKQLLENDLRFYPDYIIAHEYEPTRDKFDIIYHPVCGEGVVSKTFFNAGDILFRFDGNLLNEQTLFTLQKNIGLYIEDPLFMGKVLHSCNPNASVDMTKQEFRALRDIPSGDFITMDYETTEDELFQSFFCQCGSSNCRGNILGRKFYKNIKTSKND
jgi:hypothetical protein